MIRVLEMYRRSMREFVTRELHGLVDWPAVQFDPPEEHERWEKRGQAPDRPTRQADGRWREMIRARFPSLPGEWYIIVQSPNERPPMGWIALHGPNAVAMGGPMETETWAQIGARMREYLAKETVHGR